MKLKILLMVMIALLSSVANAEEFTFSWTVEPEKVASQNIVELRVYQDSWANPPKTADPLSGIIKIDTTVINGTANFWATYASATEESDRTQIIQVIRDVDKTDPPEPVVMSVVNGLTIEMPGGYSFKLLAE